MERFDLVIMSGRDLACGRGMHQRFACFGSSLTLPMFYGLVGFSIDWSVMLDAEVLSSTWNC
jgi:hypothetical protein